MKWNGILRRSIFPLAIGLAGATIGVAVLHWLRPEQMELRAAPPVYEDIVASLSTNGKVTPIDAFQARAATPGMVEEILVRVGQQVKPGQMLVKIRDPFAPSRLTGAIAGLQAAELSDTNVRQGGSQEDEINLRGDLKRAELEQADAAGRLKLLKELEQKGDASVAEIADAERRLALADATLQTVRDRSTKRYGAEDIANSNARIADARANLSTAKAVLANANIVSTVAGTVYAIPVAKDDFVPMGAALLNIADLNKMEIRAYFDEPDIGQLQAGEPVEVFWDAKPNMTWHGHVERPPLTVRAMESRTVGECLIGIDDAKGDLLPNTDVTVKVITSRHTHVLTVPRQALGTVGRDHFVYRVVDGKVARTAVTTGIVNLTRAEIASGLTRADVVVENASGNEALSEGQAVRVAR